MKNTGKTKEQLLKETEQLKAKITKLEKSKTERKQAEETIQEDEEKYRTLFETMLYGAVYQDDNGKIVSANPAAERILGLSVDQMQGRTSIDSRWKSIHEDGSDFPGDTHPAMVALRTGKPVKNEIMGVFHPETEEYCWININAIPQFKQGEKKPFQVYTTFEDITERKMVEKALRSSEKNYRLLAESSPEMIYLIDQEGYILYVNSVAAASFHLDAKQLIGKHLTEIYSPEVAYAHMAVIKEVFETKQKFHKEIEEEFPTGKIWIDVHLSPLINESGEVVAVLGLSNNINERKKTEKSLRESEENLRQIMKSLDEGLLVCDLNDIIMDVNPCMLEMSGYAREEMIGQTAHKLFMTPKVQAHMEKRLRERKEGKSEQYEVPIRRKNGSTLWVRISASPFRDVNGAIIGSVGVYLDITELKKAEERLINSEERFRQIAENSQEWIWEVDSNGLYTFSSQVAEHLLGYQPEEIVGKKHFYDFFLQEEREELKNAAFEVFNQRQPFREFINRNVNKNGETVLVSTSGIPILDNHGNLLGYRGADINITESKKSEDALRKSEERYRTLTENIGEGVGFIDEEETFVYTNPSAERIFGVGKGELTGLCLTNFLRGENIEIIKNETQKRRQGKSSVYEHEIVLQDGSKKDVLITATPSFDGKKFIGTFALFRDITERKRTEEEIKRKNEELQLVNAEKDKFFSIIAHDLRSPFNAFLGFTRMMVEDLHSLRLDEIQKIALSMRASATNLFSLLENLLEWSLLQRGVTTFSPIPVSLMPKISESLESALELADKKEIEISYNIPEDLVVFADENMLGSILRNLSSNAVKFTLNGGKVAINAKPIPDNLVEIFVKDTGIGMNQEMMGNLFQLDIDTSRTGTDKEPSTGLGLIICKEFVEKHGGKIWIESEEGKGSTFYFTLPAKAID